MDMTREKLVPECKGCSRSDEAENCCNTYLSPVAKWRIGKCPLATNIEKKIMTDLERKRFAGKRTSLAAIYGAVGYRFGALVSNPSHTPGSTKPTCKVSSLFKWIAKASRSYKHRSYIDWCRWSNKRCKVEKLFER